MNLKTGLVVAVTSVALLAAIFVVTRGPSVSGTWSVVADAAEGVFPNGEKWQVIPVSGELTLEQRGGSVTGSWKGRQPEPWPLTGTMEGAAFHLFTDMRGIPAMREGKEISVSRRWIFRGTIDGNTLSGSMSLAGEGDPTTQPFTAVRKPS